MSILIINIDTWCRLVSLRSSLVFCSAEVSYSLPSSASAHAGAQQGRVFLLFSVSVVRNPHVLDTKIEGVALCSPFLDAAYAFSCLFVELYAIWKTRLRLVNRKGFDDSHGDALLAITITAPS